MSGSLVRVRVKIGYILCGCGRDRVKFGYILDKIGYILNGESGEHGDIGGWVGGVRQH